ncbi:MAG: thiamine biosynthesis lipoprotein ApbE [Ilumatobacteraceae bacterium]|nr:thiamine biosynthesis lipoprotein ApbE [Ilumatobacteraceae bacterium]
MRTLPFVATDIETHEHRSRGMGSDIHLVVVGGSSHLLDEARRRIGDLEAKWSRFRPSSEISRLNAGAGSPLAVSYDTRLLVTRAIEGWRATGGSFDPTMLDSINRAGYDRSLDQLEPTDRIMPVTPNQRLFLNSPACTDIVVDHDSVTIPHGLGFDPGGIGKGIAADLVAGQLMDAGADGACVNIGGDVKVVGHSPTGDGWTIAIDHPLSDVPVTMVGLTRGAVATSSVLRRVWTVNGERRHHLIEPMTGESSTSDLALASVIAGDAWVAEVMAKAVLLRGAERAFDLIGNGCAALAVDHDGRVLMSDGFNVFMGNDAPTPHLELRTAVAS